MREKNSLENKASGTEFSLLLMSSVATGGLLDLMKPYLFILQRLNIACLKNSLKYG